jgi:hypothetical protein
MKTINKIGYKTKAEQEAEISEEVQVETIVQNINTTLPDASQIMSRAQAELKVRIQLTEKVIFGKGFSKMSSQDKKDLMDDLYFLIELDTEIDLRKI